ncbi:MAG TPA: hypothetical protein VFA41_03380 [Ktedonobacteraceae bacterium]|jgi:hypothetical protein|nr:hypothetical protein [Ktedonobacteraceae bacterium]
MATELPTNKIQWGSIIFSLDNDAFRKGFESGRRYYFVDITEEEPQRAEKLSVDDLLRQIAVPDAMTGHYRFDQEAIEHLEEYLGVLLGYMSGPLAIEAVTKE